jgi:hypothetical protein
VSLLIVALQPSERVDVASISAPPIAMPLPDAIIPPQAIVLPPEAEAEQLETKKAPAPRPPAVAATRSAAADASIEKTAIEPLKAVAIEPVAVMELTPAASESSKVTDQASNSVTITGCLASDDDTFVLKDTTGTDAPKARSWRSGFFKKRSATIELLDSTNALRLPSYVGQRVAATGTIVNHEMRAHSLRRVAASCS